MDNISNQNLMFQLDSIDHKHYLGIVLFDPSPLMYFTNTLVTMVTYENSSEYEYSQYVCSKIKDNKCK